MSPEDDGMGSMVEWTVEDDIALKSAVEAGGSLESLARGAVCFSRKFTLQELEHRWYALLYDPETSAHAAARMSEYETELLTSNPAKTSKRFKSKAKSFSMCKRKIDSAKALYYAKRKRDCNKSRLCADSGSVVSCSCVGKDGGGCKCGHQLKCSEDHQLIRTVDLSGGAVTGDGCVGQSYADRQHVESSNGNRQCSFDTKNTSSDCSHIIAGDSNHGSLKGYSDVEQLYGCDYMQKIPRANERDIVWIDNMSNLINQYDTGARGSEDLPSIDQDGVNHDQFSWNSKGGLLEPSSSNRWCSHAPGIPLWTSLLTVCSLEATNVHRNEQETLTLSDGKMKMKNNGALAFPANLDGGMFDSSLGSLGNAMVPEGEHGSHIVDTIPGSEEVLYPGRDVECILNTEDSEIPLNDHIRIPDTEELLKPIASMSTSGQAEGSDSENSVPDYFDLEALILDQDLIPWGQESDFIQPEVSRFHSPESRKDLLKLEKGACSYMNRSIMFKGAFAIIYGQHLKYYIRNTEVTVGRETQDFHVDIDLGKEGEANKISRRQAIIKMDDGGSFYMTNIGKGSIFVNSEKVPCNKRILLTSDSLIEIRNMTFIFHVNHNAVERMVRARMGSSQGNNKTFDSNRDA